MRNVDMNLLKALDALLTEQSVTRAAHRLDLSVSAMSRNLTRLRAVTGDLLLVQAGRKMVLTSYAMEVREHVHEITHEAYSLLQPTQKKLNLDTLERNFTLRANEGFINLIASTLAKELQEKAPKSCLSFIEKFDKNAQALRDGTLDLEVGVIGTNAPEMKTKTLFRDRFVGICCHKHPLLQNDEITVQNYTAYKHIVVSRKNKSRGPVDIELANYGLERQINMVVPSFSTAINIVRNSELIGLIPLSTLGFITTESNISGITYFELPVITPFINISAIWHPHQQDNLEHRWFRETIMKICNSFPIH
ncbi:LysR family transcriptional regulator [Acinetobacter nectaris]|nr:LysR family transcriptional regulator [Acinetobacter nectaris]